MGTIPKTIMIGGQRHQLMGTGKARGTYVYFNASQGRTVELVLIRLTTVGPGYAFGTVEGNRSFPTVTLSPLPGNGSTRPGSVWLVGPLQWSPTGPVASCGWLNRQAPPPRPVQTRYIGFVCHVNGAYGFITPSVGGPDLFFHRSGTVAGRLPVVGCRVSYNVSVGPRGTPVAMAVMEL